MSEDRHSEARERVLRVAEQLFMERGYRAVSMRDIANELGMQKPSLYNHTPGGKEALFVTVVERRLGQHRDGIEQALKHVPIQLDVQLRAIARWLLMQAPLHLQRLQVSDITAISDTSASHIMQLVYQTMLVPVEQIVQAAAERGEIRNEYAGMFAGTFLAAIESIRGLQNRYGVTQDEMIDQLLGLLLEGVEPR